mgnify:CR=1 FL=1
MAKKESFEDSQSITLALTSREMLFLIAYLKLPNTILIGNPFREASPDQLRDDLMKGRTTLIERRMLRRASATEWEFDSQLRFMLPFLTTPEYLLTIQTINAEGASHKMVIFFRENRGASLVYKSPYYHITLYNDDQVLLNFLLPVLNVGQRFSQGFTSFYTPSTGLLNILQQVWKEPESAQQLLHSGGVPEKEVEKSASYLAQIETASAILLSPKETRQDVKPNVAFLLVSKACLWWNEKVENETRLLLFDPIPSSPREAAQPDVYEAMFEPVLVKLDPNVPNASGHILRYLRGNPETTSASQRKTDAEVLQ